MNEELKKLREAIAACESKLNIKSTKANGELSDEEDDEEEDEEKEAMKEMMQSVVQYIYGIEDMIYKMHTEHRKGHIPPITSPGKMQKVLKALGVDDDYEVAKPLITIANTKQGMLIEASLPDKKDK